MSIQDAGYITYVVQPGDTLSGIAAHFDTTVQTLACLNHLREPDPLNTGQTIKVPEDDSPQVCLYTIKPGETLSELALRFGTTINTLAALNGITDPARIYEDQVIRIF